MRLGPAVRSVIRRRRALAVLVTLALAAGCTGPAPVVPTPSPAADDEVVTAIEVAPAGVLLVTIGASKALAAIARNAAGRVLETSVEWSSSNLAVASVDVDGTVEATAAVGTALVTAAVGGIESPPVYVTVAQPVSGAVLIEDAQIVDGPTIVDAAAEAAPDNPYEVVLRGVANLAVGSILINTGGQSVAGRVVAMQPEGNDTRVRLVVAPPTELFTDFEFSDSLDLAAGPFEIPADLAESYEVVQTGATFVFTPKPGARQPGIVLARAVPIRPEPEQPPAQAQGTRALPPLPPFNKCEATLGFGSGLPVPLALSAPPSFTFTAAGSAVREATPQGTRFVVRGTPTFKFNSVLEIRSAFEAKVECKLTLLTRQFRVPGWAGLFFGGDVEFGVGFEVGGRVTLFAAKVGGSAELRPTIEVALDCPAAASCALTGDVTATTDLTPVLEAPSLGQAQFEPSVNLFGFISLEAGNADIQQLQFKAIEVKAGAELGAGLAPEVLQIDNTNADSGRSKYALAFKGEAGPGIKLGEFLGYLGLSQVVPLKLSFELALGESPTGTVKADRAKYLPGDRASVEVKLTAASTVFPQAGIYNVDRVVLVRKVGLSTEVLATQTATDGQQDFTLAFDSPGLVDAREIFAFVVTRLLPLDPPKLEIGAAASSASASRLVISGSADLVPAAHAAAETLTAQNPGFQYAVDGPGTADGLALFCAGETDVALAARAMTGDEAARCSGINWRPFALGFYDADQIATNAALAALIDFFEP